MDFEEATHLIIINFDYQITICEILEEDVYFDEIEFKKCQVFVNRYLRYFINEKRVAQAQLFAYDNRLNRIMNIKEKGLNSTQVDKLRKCYGKGAMEIDRPSWYIILVR